MNVDSAKMIKEQKAHLINITGKSDFSMEDVVAAIDKKNADEAETKVKEHAERLAFHRDTIELGFPRAADEKHPHFVLDVPHHGDVTLAFHFWYTDRMDRKLEASFDSKTWDLIESDVQKKISSLLREDGKSDGKISVGKNRMYGLIGFQLSVLGWALEGIEDETEIEIIVAFWRRISSSDRIFLYNQGGSIKTDFPVFKRKLTDVFKTGTGKINHGDFI